MEDVGDFEGRTPLDYWLHELTIDVIHPTSAAGLTARLILLLAFSSLYVVLALVYGIIAVRCDPSRFWLARLVSGRHESRYLVLNPRIFWSFGPFVNGLYSIACIVYYYYAFSPHGAQYGLWATRSFGNFVFFVVMWPMSWCSLQAYLISSDTKGFRFLPSPHKANSACVFLGLGLAGASLALSILESRDGKRFYMNAVVLQEALREALRQNPSGFPTAAQTIELSKLSNSLSAAGEALNRSTIISASFSPILPICCLVVNAGGFLLVRKLDKQIKSSALLMASPMLFAASDPSKTSLKLRPAATSVVNSASSAQFFGRSTRTLPPGIPPLPTSIINLQRAKGDVAALTLFLSISCIAYITALVLSDISMTVNSAISSAREFQVLSS
ncbi:hypothetical protein JCM3765_006732 [Sporobolomyces pararoseus]